MASTVRQLLREAKGGSRFFYGACALIALSLCLRFLAFPIETSDYTYFVAQWFGVLKSHPGLTAFEYPFSDYAPLYLYALKFLTAFPISSLFSIKALTLLCDALMAGMCLLIVRRREWSAGKSLLCAAVFFSIPSIAVNSSLWGQSDVLYALPTVVSFYLLVKERYFLAALAFGLALSTKLQAIFFLPVLAAFLLRRTQTARYLLAIPAVYVLSLLPAWAGGGAMDSLLLVYVRQSREYTALSVSSQSVFAFFTGPQYVLLSGALFWLGIVLSGLCALSIGYLLWRKREVELTFIVSLALLCVLVVPYFLPRMHERYFYLADVFSVLYAFFYPRRFCVPLLIVGASLLAYMPYLSGQVSWLSDIRVDLRVPSAMLCAAIAFIGAALFSGRKRTASPAHKPKSAIDGCPAS